MVRLGRSFSDLVAGFFMALAAILIIPEAAQAKEKTVVVDAHSAPWDVRANPKLFFGIDDCRPPEVLFDLNLFAGETIKFAAAGTTTTSINGGSFGPDGQEDYFTNDSKGNSGHFFPSRYVDPKTYPVRLNALMGAFVDADGTVVGKPFVIGRAAAVKVPEGAVALSMGINDDIFSDNSGEITVTISYLVPTVTGQEIP
jgi:hypothetical protein